MVATRRENTLSWLAAGRSMIADVKHPLLPSFVWLHGKLLERLWKSFCGLPPVSH